MEELEFLLIMVSIFLLAGLCSVVFSKLKMPPIIGYLLAGILLVNVFTIPDSSKSVIEIMSDLGLVMLMFGIGMELNLDRLKKDGRFTILVAVIQLPLMMLIGFMVGKYMGLDSTACIAMGAIISGSSTAVVVAVMKLQPRTSKETINTLILVTVMEDIGQVIILSVVTPIFAGGTIEMTDMIILIIKIVAFMLLSIIIGIKILPRVLNWIGDNTSSEVLLVVSVGLCFLMAYLSVYVGMSMAIGAFLMGVILSTSKFRDELYEKVEPLKDIFMAVFFIEIGMEITIQGMVDNIGLALIILVTFMVGKFVTVFLGYYIGNKPFSECFVCAVSLMAMGEFAFIISEEALEYGVISNGFYTAVVIAALLSMIILPLASRYTYNVVDYMDNKPPKWVARTGDRLLALRADFYDSMGRSDFSTKMKRHVRTTYGSIILIVIIEVIFSAFSDDIVRFLMQLTGLENAYATQLYYVINLVALIVPTFVLVTGLKGIGKVINEGKKLDMNSPRRILMQSSTMLLIFVIDLAIMIIVPGPFSISSLLVMAPIMIVLLIISIILARRAVRKEEAAELKSAESKENDSAEMETKDQETAADASESETDADVPGSPASTESEVKDEGKEE